MLDHIRNRQMSIEYEDGCDVVPIIKRKQSIHKSAAYMSCCGAEGLYWLSYEYGSFITRSCEVSKSRVLDLFLDFFICSEKLTSLQQRCRDAWQMSGRYDHHKMQSRGFETLRDSCKSASKILIWLKLTVRKTYITGVSAEVQMSRMTSWHGPLARCVKLRFAHAPGMLGTFSPPPTSKKTAS